jgi:pyruvate/2-oxoglutarate/acetoin dehydrogenase E1 component
VHLLPAVDATLVGVGLGLSLAGGPVVIELAGLASLWGVLAHIGREARAWSTHSAEFEARVVLRVPVAPGEPVPLALLAALDGVAVAWASSAATAGPTLEAALRHHGPSIVLTTRAQAASSEDPTEVRIGQAQVVRTGIHVSLLALGPGVGAALAAAQKLTREGVDAEVVDLRWLNPLDQDTIATSVRRTGHSVVVGVGSGLLGAIVSGAFERLESPPGNAPVEPEAIVSAALAALRY